jgi:hypothetical protein
MNTPRRSNSLGVASLIIGVLAFLVCWIPFVNFMSILLGLIGFILAGIGLVVSMSRQGASIGYPIAGLAINGIAGGVAIVMLSLIGSAVNEVSKEAERSRTNYSERSSVRPSTVLNSSRGTVTKDEFDRIEDGMSYAQVKGIIGADGEILSQSSIAGISTVMYKWDGSGSLGANMNAMFQNGKLVSKAQFGLQ